MVKTLTASNPSEARGIRKALKAAGIKFEFKTAGKKRRKAKRNPAKKKRRPTKGHYVTRTARLGRTKSRSRRRR